MKNRQTTAVEWAIAQRGISHGAARALIVLAKHVHHKRGDWDVWPKQSTLSEACDMTLSALKRYIAELEGAQLLTRKMRYRADGGYAGCTYSLRVDDAGKAVGDWPEEAPDDDTPPSDIGLGGRVQDRAMVSPEIGLSPPSEFGLARTAESKEPPNKNSSDPTDRDLFGDPIEPERMSDDQVGELYTDRWNAMADRVDKIARIGKLGDKRKTSLLARVDEYEPARDSNRVSELLDRIIATIEGSQFLRGEVKSFKATPDWAVTPTYFPKLEETGYVQDAGPGYQPPAKPGERSHLEAGREARDVLHASAGATRPSARQLARGNPRRTSGVD